MKKLLIAFLVSLICLQNCLTERRDNHRRMKRDFRIENDYSRKFIQLRQSNKTLNGVNLTNTTNSTNSTNKNLTNNGSVNNQTTSNTTKSTTVNATSVTPQPINTTKKNTTKKKNSGSFSSITSALIVIIVSAIFI